ncbi:MAG: zinc ribbon domain-containing protein [Chloroflexi bacterium]|nr:zinc ribbon domain-containing protein [Chloroflexota bacterium]MCH8340475.1 zinc ribbon domain-containing protein [Chloroflexota bacterium]MCH8877210.1 zinc ribbon domain-containing protein [Chloroflexota bacterium]
MPIYEYICLECNDVFDSLRPMSQADSPIVCQTCESEHTSRMISVFFAQADGRSLTQSNGGGCACGGSCSCASLN